MPRSEMPLNKHTDLPALFHLAWSSLLCSGKEWEQVLDMSPPSGSPSFQPQKTLILQPEQEPNACPIQHPRSDFTEVFHVGLCRQGPLAATHLLQAAAPAFGSMEPEVLATLTMYC